MEEKFVFGPIQTAWLKSLRENPDRQMKHSLGQKDYLDADPDSQDAEKYHACCLGEAGLIAGVCEWEGYILVVAGCEYKSKNKSLLEVYGAIGLRSNIGGAKDNIDSLANLNDGGKTWPEIADIIEANPTRYLAESK